MNPQFPGLVDPQGNPLRNQQFESAAKDDAEKLRAEVTSKPTDASTEKKVQLAEELRLLGDIKAAEDLLTGLEKEQVDLAKQKLEKKKEESKLKQDVVAQQEKQKTLDQTRYEMAIKIGEGNKNQAKEIYKALQDTTKKLESDKKSLENAIKGSEILQKDEGLKRKQLELEKQIADAKKAAAHAQETLAESKGSFRAELGSRASEAQAAAIKELGKKMEQTSASIPTMMLQGFKSLVGSQVEGYSAAVTQAFKKGDLVNATAKEIAAIGKANQGALVSAATEMKANLGIPISEAQEFQKAMFTASEEMKNSSIASTIKGIGNLIGMSNEEMNRFNATSAQIGMGPLANIEDKMKSIFSVGQDMAKLGLGIDAGEASKMYSEMAVSLRGAYISASATGNIMSTIASSLNSGAFANLGYTNRDLASLTQKMGGLSSSGGEGFRAYLSQQYGPGQGKGAVEAGLLRYSGMGEAMSSGKGWGYYGEGGKEFTLNTEQEINNLGKFIQDQTAGMEAGSSELMQKQLELMKQYGTGGDTQFAVALLAKMKDGKLTGELTKEEKDKLGTAGNSVEDNIGAISRGTLNMESHLKNIQESLMKVMGSLMLMVVQLLSTIVVSIANLPKTLNFFNEKERVEGQDAMRAEFGRLGVVLGDTGTHLLNVKKDIQDISGKANITALENIINGVTGSLDSLSGLKEGTTSAKQIAKRKNDEEKILIAQSKNLEKSSGKGDSYIPAWNEISSSKASTAGILTEYSERVAKNSSHNSKTQSALSFDAFLDIFTSSEVNTAALSESQVNEIKQAIQTLNGRNKDVIVKMVSSIIKEGANTQ